MKPRNIANDLQLHFSAIWDEGSPCQHTSLSMRFTVTITLGC
jgi:hypothetical protein